MKLVIILITLNLLSGCSPKLLAAVTGVAEQLAQSRSPETNKETTNNSDLEQCYYEALAARNNAINSNLIGYSVYQDPSIAYKYAMTSCELRVLKSRNENN